MTQGCEIEGVTSFLQASPGFSWQLSPHLISQTMSLSAGCDFAHVLLFVLHRKYFTQGMKQASRPTF
jgi:hypothetical protein